jgi:hypothetical protein
MDLGETRAAFMELLEGSTPFVEACTGYKAKLIEAGFSVEVAEEMVVHFHEMIMHSVMYPGGV